MSGHDHALAEGAARESAEAAARFALVRQCLDGFNRGDVPALLEMVDEWMEIDETSALPGGRFYHGVQGFREWLVDVWERWSELQFELPDDYVETPSGALVTTATGRASGSSTGVPVEATFTFLCEFRRERIARFAVFYDRRAALKAAGVLDAQ